MDSDEELVYLDAGCAEDAQARQRPGRPRQRWLWLLLAAVLVGAAVVQANRHSPAAAPSTRSTAPFAVVPAPASTVPVTVTALAQPWQGLPWLGEIADWTLFGRGDGMLVRINLARSAISSTVVPPLQSSGPVSFIPAAGEVIIRPIDMVPSYAVPDDGRPVQRLPAAFGSGDPILPGPDPGHVWRVTGFANPTAILTALDGSATGTVIRLPADASNLDAVGDGAGYLLVTTVDGVYRAQPGRVLLISTGSLLAVGPTGWLVAECDPQRHCQRVLIDRRNNQRRVVDRVTATGSLLPLGAISPGGRTAAILDTSHDQPSTIELLDLATGAVHATGIDLREPVAEGAIGWSPDSRWLFAIDLHGGLVALDSATGQVRSLPALLPPLAQLAIRPVG